MIRMPQVPLLAVYLTFLGGVGCSGSAGKSEDEAKPQPIAVQVEVENQNSQDITVYLLRGNSRMRLGTVTSMRTESFQVSIGMAGGGAEIRLLADPVGAFEQFASLPVRIEVGDTVRWRLAPRLTQSAIFVY
ncbi:MAG: hypothetical protein JSU87_10820 [Gemmatimonadota bacterium]|nr:MAG: hypothetical protein JSU87_10820 [Gemmatimonadota bacterium]